MSAQKGPTVNLWIDSLFQTHKMTDRDDTLVSAKKPYISGKEPHISAKEPCVTLLFRIISAKIVNLLIGLLLQTYRMTDIDELVFPHKSSISPQKSPISPQKSPISLVKSPIHPHKEPYLFEFI